MIALTPHMRILVAVELIDFRAGIDALAEACRRRLKADPFSGALFVFGNRRRTAIKILVYDEQGFWLCLPSGCRLASSPSGPPPGSPPMRGCVAHRRRLRPHAHSLRRLKT